MTDAETTYPDAPQNADAAKCRSRGRGGERSFASWEGRGCERGAAGRNRAAPTILARLALKACLIARDAAFNVRDLLTNSSRMAFLAIKDCEKELDLIERQIDEQLPAAITRVNEARARQLLSNLKSTTDLERIGDLVMSVAMRAQARTSKMAASDVRQLVEMSAVLREMLDLIHKGFSTLDLECARKRAANG